jgi:isochorismate synthase/2-succinyl-5-enolpyruvyl-6-hydroxy-3-cyclohexene-1-carboxylate synthase/2-succinyl-6-hydroxy-2,4-cyclohexadiene-1-carboxylate synthase/O-succinylbenzoate synthase
MGLVEMLMSARRGLLVVGELVGSEEVAAVMKLAALLGWPVAADVLSGMRVGTSLDPHANLWREEAKTARRTERSGTPPLLNQEEFRSASNKGLLLPKSKQKEPTVIYHMDHLLLGGSSWWACLKPDVILQVGSHVTSKRLAQFLVRRVELRVSSVRVRRECCIINICSCLCDLLLIWECRR